MRRISKENRRLGVAAAVFLLATISISAMAENSDGVAPEAVAAAESGSGDASGSSDGAGSDVNPEGESSDLTGEPPAAGDGENAGSGGIVSETETKADETLTVSEDEAEADSELKEEIIGTWALDDITSLEFSDNEKGKMIVADEDFPFKYKIKDDKVSINFSSSKASDVTYTAAVSGDTLHLGLAEDIEGEGFDLARAE